MKVAEAYKPFLQDTERFCILYGSAGSGKSYAATQKIIMRVLSEKNHRILVVRKIAKTLKTSVYDLFRAVLLNESLDRYFNCTTVPMEIKCKSNNNTIIFTGLDDPEKIKSISDISCIFCEEATELDENDFIQLNLRVRGKTENYKQIILTFNPTDMKSYLYKYFFKDKIYKASIYKTTYLDNPFIDDEYREQLESLAKRNELYYQVYALGNWATLSETVVFKGWKMGQAIHKTEENYFNPDIYSYDKVTAGIDYGFSHASVCTVLGFKEDKLYILREIYKKGLTNNEFINTIKNELPEWGRIVFFADSAEPARIKEFRQNGIETVSVKKGKKSVSYAIDYLLRYKIIANPKCENTIEELGTFQYLKDERNGVIYTDKFDNDNLYDCIASMRYAINKQMRKTKMLKPVHRLIGI